jgi:hypothetical protein
VRCVPNAQWLAAYFLWPQKDEGDGNVYYQAVLVEIEVIL